MAQRSSQAVILQTTDYGESDRIVTLYSQDFGKLKGIAKGAKRSQKRFGSALEPFTHNEVVFVDKRSHGLVRLERCHIIQSFQGIAHDIKKVILGNYLLELVNALTAEKEKNAEIFTLLLFFIKMIQEKSFREELTRIFEFRLFSLIGYQPQFMCCVVCGEEFDVNDNYQFSIKRGGIVCSGCQNQLHDLMKLSNGTIRIFQQAQNLDLSKLHRIFFSQSEHKEGKEIFAKFLEYHIGRKPRSLEIMKQIAQPI